MLNYLLLINITVLRLVNGYKWFSMSSYSGIACNSSSTKQITLFQAQKCTQVNSSGVISSFYTDCSVGKILYNIY
jgi:hypothetical protein